MFDGYSSAAVTNVVAGAERKALGDQSDALGGAVDKRHLIAMGVNQPCYLVAHGLDAPGTLGPADHAVALLLVGPGF